MLDWLFEGRPTVYVTLAGLAGFLLLIGWQRRKRWSLVAVAVAAGLIGLYAVLDFAVETDREQIVRKINAMAAAVNAHNLDAALVHISDEFRSPAGKTKKELRDAGQVFLDQKIVESVEVWAIECVGAPSRAQPTARVFFSAKVHGRQEFLTDCDATFDFHPQHGWRLKGLRLLKPQTTEEWSQQI